VTAAALGLVAIALAAVVAFVVHPERNRLQAEARAVGLSPTAQQAVDAGTQEVVNLLTYSRKTFDADYARTLAGTSGALNADLTKQKATLLQQMTQGKFDLQGSVTSSAFEQTSGSNTLILVSAEGYKLPDGGQRTLASTARFEITMTRVGGKWLATNLQSVGLI
jgi:Mce-associated membrane protein